MIHRDSNLTRLMRRFIRAALTAGGIALIGMLPRLAMASATIPGIGSGSGTPVWTLYTIGDGAVLYGLLMSIKAFVTSASYLHMILFVTVVGFLVSSSMAVAQTRLSRIGTSLTLIALITYLAFQVKVDVQIDDTASNYVNVVTGVPALVGLPAAGISEIGHYLTKATEQNFNLPGYSGLELSNGGLFNMSAQTVHALSQPVINDMPLRATFNNYFNDCVILALANGKVTINDLMYSSPNGNSGALIYQLQKAASNSIFTQDYLVNSNSGPVSETCNFTYNNIYNTLQKDYPHLLDNTMGQAFQVYGATGAGANLFSTAITNGFTWLTGGSSSPSPQSLVIQSAVMNMMQSGFTYAAAQTGSSPIISSINIQQSINQQKSSWWAAGQLFAKIGPLFYVVLYSFVIGLAPIIIVGLFIPRFGGMMAASYFQILLWLALWQPAFAILNYILALFEKNASTTVMSQDGTWSMATHTVVNQAANDYILIGGFLGSLIPMILFAIVKQGSMAFTGFLEAASSKSAVLTAGNSMASGDLNLGNESIDNTNMNKYDIATSRTAGSHGVTTYQGAGSATDMQIMSGMGSSAANQMSSESVTVTRGEQMQNSFSRGETAANESMAGMQSSFGQTYSHVMQLGQEKGLHFNNQGQVVDQQGAQVHSKLAQAMQEAQSVKTAMNRQSAATGHTGYTAGAKANAGGEFFGNGVDTQVGTSHGHEDSNTVESNRNADHSNSQSTTAGKEKAYDHRLAQQEAASKTIQQGVNKLHQQKYMGDDAYKKVSSENQTYQQSLSKTRSAVSEAAESTKETFTKGVGVNTDFGTLGNAGKIQNSTENFRNKGDNQVSSQGNRISAEARRRQQKSVTQSVQGQAAIANNNSVPGMPGSAMSALKGMGLNPSDLGSVPGGISGTQQQISAANHLEAIQQNNNNVNSGLNSNSITDSATSAAVKAHLLGGNGSPVNTTAGEIKVFNDPSKELTHQTDQINGYKLVGGYSADGGKNWQALYQADGASKNSPYYTFGDNGSTTVIEQPTAADRRSMKLQERYNPVDPLPDTDQYTIGSGKPVGGSLDVSDGFGGQRSTQGQTGTGTGTDRSGEQPPTRRAGNE